jgi:hypothetical protein
MREHKLGSGVNWQGTLKNVGNNIKKLKYFGHESLTFIFVMTVYNCRLACDVVCQILVPHYTAALVCTP